jgi:hypothetical protein
MWSLRMMHAERNSWRDGSHSDPLVRPRVVVLGHGETARVEVLELPEATTLGSSFSYCGRSWRITASRTSDRVLIAEPTRN